MSRKPLRFADVMYSIIRGCIAVGIVAAVARYYIDVSQRDTIVIQGLPERQSEAEAAEPTVSLPEQTLQQESSIAREAQSGVQTEYSVPDLPRAPSDETVPAAVSAADISAAEPVEINISGLQASVAQQQDSPAPAENSWLININSAPASELVKLDGIGEAKARAIVEYREEHGYFTSVDDLVKVSGIGAKTLEKNRDKITV
ncbi:MAG: ComEA family DNA-binding protein [Oscillospiraceae bacterium]